MLRARTRHTVSILITSAQRKAERCQRMQFGKQFCRCRPTLGYEVYTEKEKGAENRGSLALAVLNIYLPHYRSLACNLRSYKRS